MSGSLPSWEQEREAEEAQLQVHLASPSSYQRDQETGHSTWFHLLNPLQTLTDWQLLFSDPLAFLVSWIIWLALSVLLVIGIWRWLFQ